MNKKIWSVPLIALGIEAIVTAYFFSKLPTAFDLVSHLFFWGIIDLFLGLSYIFGFENRGALSQMSADSNASYNQNTSNFLDHINQAVAKQFSDTPSGLCLIALAFLNLLLYFLFSAL